MKNFTYYVPTKIHFGKGMKIPVTAKMVDKLSCRKENMVDDVLP